ncbi:MAG: hypothetical protein U0X92_17590 [Anaerolineales bacterium]
MKAHLLGQYPHRARIDASRLLEPLELIASALPSNIARDELKPRSKIRIRVAYRAARCARRLEPFERRAERNFARVESRKRFRTSSVKRA